MRTFNAGGGREDKKLNIKVSASSYHNKGVYHSLPSSLAALKSKLCQNKNSRWYLKVPKSNHNHSHHHTSNEDLHLPQSEAPFK